MSRVEGDTEVTTPKHDISKTNEYRTRYEMTVACRISDMKGLSDDCGGFTVARIPGENAVLMRGQHQNPGLVTVSGLHKCNIDDEPVFKKNHPVNGGALQMAVSVIKARPDVGCAFHGHTPASMVFSALEVELLPISQFGTMFCGKINKMPALEDVNTSDWCEVLVDQLGDNPALLFANHGILVVGRDCRQALHNLYALEQAMTVQISAMQTGAKITVLSEEAVIKNQELYWGGDPTTDYDGSREWDSWVERVRRADPHFAD